MLNNASKSNAVTWKLPAGEAILMNLPPSPANHLTLDVKYVYTENIENTSHVGWKSEDKMKRRKAFQREEKMIQIMAVFAKAYLGGQEDMLLSEVARALDNAPSTRLRQMLYSLVTQGALVYWHEPHAGIVNYRNVFALSGDFKLKVSLCQYPPAKPRTVKVKVNGKQIEMDLPF